MSVAPARRFFPTKLFRFCDLAPQAKFCNARFINRFLHETTFRHKPYGGKECVPFRPFFLPQQAVVSKAREQSW